MYRLISRIVMTLCVGGSCYCFSNPEAPHRLLSWYVETQGQPAAETANADGAEVAPRKDIAFAQAAIKFLEKQHGVSSSRAPQSPFIGQREFDQAFFSDEDPYSNPSVLSELKRPFGEQAADLRYAPIETGPVIQSNPYLQ
jgi:hypothetical protein